MCVLSASTQGSQEPARHLCTPYRVGTRRHCSSKVGGPGGLRDLERCMLGLPAVAGMEGGRPMVRLLHSAPASAGWSTSREDLACLVAWVEGQ